MSLVAAATPDPEPDPEEITQLLQRAIDGDASAEAAVLDVVYKTLHRLAQRQMRSERPDHTLQPTALVNEAFLRVLRSRGLAIKNRGHFYATFSTLMRRILIDHARHRRAAKNDGALQRTPLDDAAIPTRPDYDTWLQIDQLLTELATLNPRQAKIVELIYFSGMTENEVAGILAIGSRTVGREWSAARAWLHYRLNPPPPQP